MGSKGAERVLCREEASAGRAPQTSSVFLDHTLMRDLCESWPLERPTDESSFWRSFKKQQQKQAP